MKLIVGFSIWLKLRLCLVGDRIGRMENEREKSREKMMYLVV